MWRPLSSGISNKQGAEMKELFPAPVNDGVDQTQHRIRFVIPCESLDALTHLVRGPVLFHAASHLAAKSLASFAAARSQTTLARSKPACEGSCSRKQVTP